MDSIDKTTDDENKNTNTTNLEKSSEFSFLTLPSYQAPKRYKLAFKNDDYFIDLLPTKNRNLTSTAAADIMSVQSFYDVSISEPVFV